jgi:single-stranded DNA-binding protein
MSIDVLLSGRMAKPAEQRTARTGSTYALAQVIVPTEGEESVLCSCIAFSRSAVEALLALDRGEAVSLAGKAKMNVWERDGETKVGLNITVDAVLTPYHVQRKRRAAQGDANGEPDDSTHVRSADRGATARDSSRRAIPAAAGSVADMSDDIPFP